MGNVIAKVRLRLGWDWGKEAGEDVIENGFKGLDGRM